jgi:excisionase family DNA binding protein
MTSEETNLEPRHEILTFGELAEFLRWHPSMQSQSATIYRLLRQGQLRAVKIGSQWGFSRESIDRLVQLESSK